MNIDFLRERLGRLKLQFDFKCTSSNIFYFNGCIVIKGLQVAGNFVFHWQKL